LLPAIDSATRHIAAGKRSLLDLAGKTLAAHPAAAVVTDWRTAGSEEREQGAALRWWLMQDNMQPDEWRALRASCFSKARH